MMAGEDVPPPVAPVHRLPIVIVLLAASGCAALVYQIVWFQLLGLVLGTSAVSLGVLLATFMGGLCLGSVLLPRLVGRHRHPLRVMAAIEIGIALLGAAVLHTMPALAAAYGAWAAPGVAGLAWRAAVAALCLLGPTVLMGATLPAAARWAQMLPRGVSSVGLLYAANIAGGVLGCLLAGFYLLRTYDAAVATYAAVAMNLLAAGGALWLARAAVWPRARHAQEPAAPVHEGRAPAARSPLPVYAVIALSGMTALAAEVVWTRHLALVFGATVYAFALILAVFLLGLGLGSGAGAALARSGNARAALAACQLGLCGALAWAAFLIARALPFWPIDVTLPAAPGILLQIDALRAAVAVLPAAFLWGMSFPLALAAVRDADWGRLVGRVYAANTIGAIAGALGATFVLMAALGSQATQQLLIAASGAAALVVLAATREWPLRTRATAGAAVLLCAAAAAALVPRLPPEVIAYGRYTPTRGYGANVLHAEEGRTSSIAVSEDAAGIRTFHSAGKAQASSYAADMRLQKMLGHLTTLTADTPESFFVIGLGAGVTAGAVAADPAARRVVVAEIEPAVPRVARAYFAEHNFAVMSNPAVEVRIDDGRHALATAREKYDGITSDPLDPWVRGAAALYTREFWTLVRSRLNPGGVVTVFVQLYESSEAAVKSEIATFFEVFPDGAVFANTIEGKGYDVVLLARGDGTPIDVDRMHARLQSARYADIARSLAAAGFRSATDLLATYVGGSAELAAWLKDAQINRDRNLRLQYLAGRSLNAREAEEMFGEMTAERPVFPRRLFTGSPARLEELRQKMRAAPAGTHDGAR